MITVSVVLASGTVGAAFAEEYPALFRGVRPLGMGGAFLTVSNDENALFYNPAGLDDVKGHARVTILNPYVAASRNSIGLYRDIADLEGTDEAQVADLLNRHVGEHQHSEAAFFPNVYMRDFAIGVLGRATMDLDVRNPADPEVATDARVDVAGLVGVAHGFWNQVLQVGATGKYVRREGVKKTFQTADIVVNFDPFANRDRETDFAFDLGTKLNLPLLFRPSVALVLQNIGGLDFGTLGADPQQLHFGVAIHPDFWDLSNTLALEIHDLTKQIDGDNDTSKRIHIGAEVRFPKILALQAGVNQGYYTAGATLDFGILTLAAATYAEELGVVAGQRADRRYVAQVGLGF